MRKILVGNSMGTDHTALGANDMQQVEGVVAKDLLDVHASADPSSLPASSGTGNRPSLATLISQRANDALSQKSHLDMPVKCQSSFFEECLDPVPPMQSTGVDAIPDSFVSFSQYLRCFDSIRANESRYSICTSIFENSRYRRAVIHSVGNMVSFKATDFESEQYDVLYFSRSKTYFKSASMSLLAKDLESGSFLGIVGRISGLENRGLVDVQVSAGVKHLRRGQSFFYRYAGNIITALREYNALWNLSSSKLLRHVLRPSFLADFMDRRVTWDRKRLSIVDTPSPGHAHTQRQEEGVHHLSKLLMDIHKLNSSQARAVAQGFHSKEKFFLIQGPPGTGKTTTILSIISAFLLDTGAPGGISSKRILVCAPSNTAVDVVVLRIAKGVQSLSGENVAVPVIRVGCSTNTLVREYTLEHLTSVHPDRARSAFLAGASVVCTTLSSSASEFMNGMKFDLLIIDEACQSTEISTLVPLRHDPPKVIMIGDPCQLPPTVISPQTQLKKSLFERMLSAHQPVLLDTQYRMHTDICSLSSRLFYGSQLKTSPEINALKRQARGHDVLLGCPPLAFIDVCTPSERIDELKSYYNPAEASICIEICKRLAQRCGKASVVALSPYKAQVAALRKLGVEASTIDAFQGKEADVVILSAVRQNGLGFTNDARRINVAITRSRECLVILGSSSCLRKSPLWSQILDHIKARSGFFDFDQRHVFLERIQPARNKAI